MAAADDILLKIGVDISDLAGTLSDATGLLASLGEKFGAAFAVDKIAHFVEAMVDANTEANRLASMLGVTASEFSTLTVLATDSGTSIQSLAFGMERLSFNLQRAQSGAGPTAEALRALGINTRDFLALNTEQRLARIADEFAKYDDGANKTAVAIALFGRAGAQMIPELDGGRAAILEARREAERLGVTLRTDASDQLENLHHSITMASNAFLGFGERIVAIIAPAVAKLIGGLAELVGWLNKLLDALFELDEEGRKNKGQMPGLPNEDAIKAQRTRLEEAIDNIKAVYETEKLLAENSVAFHRITEQQKAEILRGMLNQEMDAIKGYYDRLKAETARTEAERAEIDRAYNKERLKAVEETLKEEIKARQDALKQWESIGTAITESWNSQMRGLLAGTETFKEAVGKMLGDLLIKVIEFFEKIIMERIAAALATSIGAPLQIAGNMKGIFGDVGQAYAGLAAFYAPILGPAAPGVAAAEAATIQGTATAITAVGLETGAWEIPGAMMAMLHPGEMVVPAGPAAAIREGGGGGSVNVSFNVSAIDGASVQQFFRQHATKIAAVVSGSISRNSSLRPTY